MSKYKILISILLFFLIILGCRNKNKIITMEKAKVMESYESTIGVQGRIKLEKDGQPFSVYITKDIGENLHPGLEVDITFDRSDYQVISVIPSLAKKTEKGE